ncbi:phasin family protein [Actibacterium sp.]|uniref:phasin family protein n=1 Tax=Actibacterium sp. TaxID=1872125 RepID=UPI00356158C0
MAKNKGTKVPDMSEIPGMKEAQDGMALMGQIGKMMLDHMGRSGAGFAAFVNARLKQDAEVRQEIMACRDVDELKRIQSAYLKGAMEQFSVETEKAVRDGTKVLEDVMKRAQKPKKP